MPTVPLFCSNGDQPGDALSPNIVLPLAPALKLHHPTHNCLQTKVTPVLPALEKVAARPGRHISYHLQHHICENQKEMELKMNSFDLVALLLS